MGLEENKRLALDILTASVKHDGPRFAELLHPQGTYWTAGKPELFGYAGERGHDDICAYFATPTIFLDGGLKMSFGAVTAEGDRVTVEAKSRGELPDGRVYSNDYHYLITIRDGKVWQIKEYVDTYAAADFFSK